MKYTNKYGLPSSVVEALKENTYDVPLFEKNLISISMLNSPPRIRQLQLRHWDEIQVDASERIWLLMGSAIHEVLARIQKKNRLVEERMTEPVLGYKVTGKPDLYDISTKTVEDYKITSVWAVQELKTEWEQQLNCYCWFLRKLGFKVNHAYIDAFLRDWNRYGLKRNADYPPIPFKRLKVKLWTFEKQERYIESRLKLHIRESKKSDDQLVLCTPEERWATKEEFAVYKGKNKRATRLFASKSEATKLHKKIENARIEHRPSKDIRCLSYCQVAKFCSYYQANYGNESNV